MVAIGASSYPCKLRFDRNPLARRARVIGPVAGGVTAAADDGVDVPAVIGAYIG